MVRARFEWSRNTLCWLAFVVLYSFFYSPAFTQDIVRNAMADGELHDMEILTLDRMIAVGDRGLILGSDNAGKTWTVRNSRSEFTLPVFAS